MPWKDEKWDFCPPEGVIILGEETEEAGEANMFVCKSAGRFCECGVRNEVDACPSLVFVRCNKGDLDLACESLGFSNKEAICKWCVEQKSSKE